MAPPAKIRARRRAVAGLVVGVIFLGFLLFAVFPTRSWWQQRDQTAAAEAELADLRAERAELEREQELLLTDAEIERRAKEEFSFVYPGEEAFAILPAPVEPIGLPQGWPFTGVERVFGAS